MAPSGAIGKHTFLKRAGSVEMQPSFGPKTAANWQKTLFHLTARIAARLPLADRADFKGLSEDIVAMCGASFSEIGWDTS